MKLELRTNYSHEGYEIKAKSHGHGMCNLEQMGVGHRGWQEGIDIDRRNGRGEAGLY